jgi:hypothetical protein
MRKAWDDGDREGLCSSDRKETRSAGRRAANFGAGILGNSGMLGADWSGNRYEALPPRHPCTPHYPADLIPSPSPLPLRHISK